MFPKLILLSIFPISVASCSRIIAHKNYCCSNLFRLPCNCSSSCARPIERTLRLGKVVGHRVRVDCTVAIAPFARRVDILRTLRPLGYIQLPAGADGNVNEFKKVCKPPSEPFLFRNLVHFLTDRVFKHGNIAVEPANL